MVPEKDAEHVENFTFVPVGSAPDRIYRVDFGAISVEAAFDAQSHISFERMQVINDLKPRLGRMPIDRGDAAQADELFIALQITAQIDDLAGLGDQSSLAQRFVCFQDGGVIHCCFPSFSADQSSAPFFQT